jgi:hypothetical protein
MVTHLRSQVLAKRSSRNVTCFAFYLRFCVSGVGFGCYFAFEQDDFFLPNLSHVAEPFV